MKREQTERILLGTAVCAGFLAGSMLPEILKMGSGTYAGLLSQYSLSRYLGIQPDSLALFMEIFQKRGGFFFFLWMSSYTAAGLIFHGISLFLQASAAGVLLGVFLLKQGYEGALLFFCCLMPQWVLYLGVWREELSFLFRKRYRGLQALPDGVSVLGRQDLKTLGRIGVLCALGCLAESFLGIWTMKLFLQFF